jgi:hypothetical protein
MAAAVTDYTTLTSAINDLTEGGYASGETDRFIGLAESDFRLYFGPHFAKETASASLAFTSGSAALPAGFIRPLSLVHSTYGGLTEASIGAVRERRVWDTSGIPSIYAVTGSTVETASSYTGNLRLDYEGSITGLSSGNATNWLVTNAPQVYLAMCVYYAQAFDEDPAAPNYQAAAMQRLRDLSIQSMVATQGRATVTIPGPTP